MWIIIEAEDSKNAAEHGDGYDSLDYQMFSSPDTARVDSIEEGNVQNLSVGENTFNPYYGLDDTFEGNAVVKVTENPYYSGMEV